MVNGVRVLLGGIINCNFCACRSESEWTCNVCPTGMMDGLLLNGNRG